MLWTTTDTPYNLRPKTGGDSFEETINQVKEGLLPAEDELWVVCRQCAQRLSRPSERIVVSGTHNHTFANPNGVVFEIGCYQMVTGCSFIGPPSYEFPWFAGYSWQIIICSSCQSHLGWVFRGQGGAQFFGLILDRISEIIAPQ